MQRFIQNTLEANDHFGWAGKKIERAKRQHKDLMMIVMFFVMLMLFLSDGLSTKKIHSVGL
jgi:hypothetical protein